jgi:serine/threonine protein kinase
MNESPHAEQNNFPDFSDYGFLISKELGNNRAGGRVTYLAIDIKTQQKVVIKQFQFAQLNSSWSEYDSYQQEIKVLQQLNHPNIPCYLDSFQTSTGFCLVQEYKNASSLVQLSLFSTQEIKLIAIEILKVLIYLQQQNPPIIHRDLKPENILVERQEKLTIYLVDFGFARLGSGEVAMSSVVKGTLGFMPPEQLFNRELTPASDLYSLGMTLICLLTMTKSAEIGRLIDDNYQVDFQALPQDLNPEFVRWLETMVALNPKNRYHDAASALAALTSLPVYGGYNRKALATILTAVAIGVWLFNGLIYITHVTPNYSWNQAAAPSSPAPQPTQIQQPPENSKELLKKKLLETRECQKCDLSGMDFYKANLAGANLIGSNLTNTKFVGANLAGADLSDANLKEVSFLGANLVGARLDYADLRNASGNPNLTNASLRLVNLTGVKFVSAVLFAADLSGANLNGADLKSANLMSAKLQGADLTNADLWNANLSGAILYGATLTGVDFTNAYLKDAVMPDRKIHP